MQDQNNRITIAGKQLKKATGNCYSQFPDINNTRVELSYPEIGSRTIAKEDYIFSKWTRVNLRWKGGQPKSPNGPTKNFSSQVKTHFPRWIFLISNS